MKSLDLVGGPGWRGILWVLWQLGIYLPEDRRLLVDVILQHYRGRPEFSRILFVGVGSYVRHYSRMFSGQQFVTIDADARRARYGAAQHVIDRVENMSAYFAQGFFDLIIMNGVIGWGLNDLAAVDHALDVCHRHLRPCGELVLSTDARRPCHGRLGESRTLRTGFAPLVFGPLGRSKATARVPWHARSEHEFFFFRKNG